VRPLAVGPRRVHQHVALRSLPRSPGAARPTALPSGTA
jgi:hypothetical protein